MKIAIEIGWAHKLGGARRVAIKTLCEMKRLRPSHQYIILCNSPVYPFYSSSLVFKTPALIPQVVWDQAVFPHVAVPLAAMKLKPDVIHYTNNIMSFWINRPAVVTIHDMLPFIMPDSFVSVHGAYQRAYMRFAAKKARKIITVSEVSRQDICRILNVDEEKIVVAPNAANLVQKQEMSEKDLEELDIRLGIKKPFILYVGAIHPRKNVNRLLEAYHLLKTRHSIDHQLVIVGAIGWKKREAINAKTLNKVKKQVILTGSVDDDTLVCLYKRCSAFVYPSLYEGFGLPVLEAMSMGAPVVTSNTSALIEVARDAAILVDPLEVEDIAQGILKIINNLKLSQQLSKKAIQRASDFSWAKTAQKVLETLESVV